MKKKKSERERESKRERKRRKNDQNKRKMLLNWLQFTRFNGSTMLTAKRMNGVYICEGNKQTVLIFVHLFECILSSFDRKSNATRKNDELIEIFTYYFSDRIFFFFW